MSRGAPPIAAKNAADAFENISRKRDQLLRALKEHRPDGALDNVLECAPKSVRQFNLWTGFPRGLISNSADFVECRANSNQTIRAHSEMLFEVQKLVKAIKECSERPLIGRREQTIAGLQASLRAEKNLTAIANREVIRARFLLSELRDRHDVVAYAKQSSDAEAKRVIAELQSRVSALEVQNSELQKRLSGDSRIRRV